MLPDIGGLEILHQGSASRRAIPRRCSSTADSVTDRVSVLTADCRRLPHQTVQPQELVAPGCADCCGRWPPGGRGPQGRRPRARRHASRVTRGGEEIALTVTEVRAAALPDAKPQAGDTRAEILDRVWNYSFADVQRWSTLHLVSCAWNRHRSRADDPPCAGWGTCSGRPRDPAALVAAVVARATDPRRLRDGQRRAIAILAARCRGEPARRSGES